ncbi:hypothetical protein LCGC14_1056450 [marine sediment metagenome]|uniref:Uncharacterized protein n=1 Tax=marine sediment metagenome TaxID=412755 RepID=A0A0F9MRW1_9ZZZZ
MSEELKTKKTLNLVENRKAVIKTYDLKKIIRDIRNNYE